MTESFLTKGQNVQIVLSIDDLRTVIYNILDEREAEKQSDEEKLLTASEVCQRLKISKPTLHRWKKTGYIKSTKVRGSLRFRESDVVKFLEDKK